jgi:eukaryotic-like serine/threonine-protein kinase
VKTSRRAPIVAVGFLLVATMPAAVSVAGQDRLASSPGSQPLTVFDRQGKVVTMIGEPGVYVQPAFSPDGTRVAVAKVDPQTQTTDIWVLSLAEAQSTRITSDPAADTEPVWSPDGTQLAFISRRAGIWRVYRAPSSGVGREELVYQHAGFGGISNLASSADGRYLTFSDLINISGAVYVLPLDGLGNVKEVLRPPLFSGRISPDGQAIAYSSNLSGRAELYIRPFDASSRGGPAPAGEPRQVSRDGALGAAVWRLDGHELYYLAPGVGVMAASVTTMPTLRADASKLLFKAPSNSAALRLASVSSDGQRFIFAIPPAPPVRQLTVFDRRGKSLRVIGEAGPYGQPSLSPDGSRVAVIHNDIETGNQDIWTFEIATGTSHVVTSDPAPDSAPVWSSDGKAIAFVSTRGDYTGVYRKAWDGTGREELLYQHTPGTPSLVLTDWSTDGRFLTFYAGDILYALLLDGNRKAFEIERTEFSTVGGRFSPDGRFIAYLSDQSGRYEVYIRPFGVAAGQRGEVVSRRWQVSTQGALGMVFWRQDARELCYLGADGSLMAVDVTAAPEPQFGTPRILFRPPNSGGGGAYGATGNPVQLRNVSHDGKRFVFAVQPGSVPSPR